MNRALIFIPRFFVGLYKGACAWWAFLKEPPIPSRMISDLIEMSKEEQMRMLVAEGNERYWRTHHERVMALLMRSPIQEVRDAAKVAEIVISTGDAN